MDHNKFNDINYFSVTGVTIFFFFKEINTFIQKG